MVARSSSVAHWVRLSSSGWIPHLTSTSLLDRTPSAGSMKAPRSQSGRPARPRRHRQSASRVSGRYPHTQLSRGNVARTSCR